MGTRQSSQTSSTHNAPRDNTQDSFRANHIVSYEQWRRVAEVKCPVCSKKVTCEEFELHFTMCITKPMLQYNIDEVDDESLNECSICLDTMKKGDKIARLPCLCVFHKYCVDQWFEVSRTCPNHPEDDDE
ncbi:hypothetical protein SNEBB_001051 [Seison nebaliae]|nr:hypothetical protein SNEBB_001051 [Seison nebaliae]